jgi:hypothetical protein
MTRITLTTKDVARIAASLLVLLTIVWRFIMFPDKIFANIALAVVFLFIAANLFLYEIKSSSVRLLRIVWFAISVILILIWGLLETGHI